MRMEHHDVRDVHGPRLMAALRAYHHLIRARDDWFRECAEFYAADRQFDGGEFGGGSGYAETVHAELSRLADVVAARFDVTGYAVMLADCLDGNCREEAWADARHVTNR